MTVRVYRSSDASAPAIDLSIGSLITLLDACLVNGYGALPPLGWSKQFSGTNKAIYLQGTGGAGNALRVHDDVVNHVGSSSYGASSRLCGVRGATGIDSFPTRFGDGVTGYIHKPDAVASGGAWVLVGNETGFYLFTKRSGWGIAWSSFFFGDLISAYPNPEQDIGKTLIQMCNSAATLGSPPPSNYDGAISYWSGALSTAQHPGSKLAGNDKGIYSDGNYGGYSVNQTCAFFFMKDDVSYPSRIGGGIVAVPGYITLYQSHPETTSSGSYDKSEIRGRIPGRYTTLHHASKYTPPAQKQYVFTSGELAGKTLEVFYIWNYSDSAGGYSSPMLIEISDTW